MKIYSPKTSDKPWSLNVYKEWNHKVKPTKTVDEYGNMVIKNLRLKK